MPQQQTSSPGQGQRFDWWAAPAASAPPGRSAEEPPPAPTPVPVTAPYTAQAQARLTAAAPAEPSVRPLRGHAVPPQVPARPAAPPAVDSSTEVYRAVQASEAFQDIKRGYRAFVFPVSAAFLGWYLLYVAAQAGAPGVMRTRIAGPLNVAWLLGLLQFASTFLLTWLYARNARTKRDRAALELRWDTQDQLR
ncbi:DUF485 domain-containing protein [Kitasatospora sp. NPDC056181]|uniref:DUF485 domain-containing protein n=1 Tax=Kitasatospora sp. NPDC056181 TaxID=3345737 RepID=UPI0035D73967